MSCRTELPSNFLTVQIKALNFELFFHLRTSLKLFLKYSWKSSCTRYLENIWYSKVFFLYSLVPLQKEYIWSLLGFIQQKDLLRMRLGWCATFSQRGSRIHVKDGIQVRWCWLVCLGDITVIVCIPVNKNCSKWCF